MKVSRGDIILVNHPFSDASGSKVRPALVVQNDHRNALLAETIVALISKNIAHVTRDPTQFLIDIGTASGRVLGLRVNSAVKCGKLFTVGENLLLRKIGVLSATQKPQLNDCLKAALELP